MNKDDMERKLNLVYFIMNLSLCFLLLNACTTAAPTDEQAVGSTQNDKANADLELMRSLRADYEALKSSVFVALSKDAKDLELWEKSEAWIKLYQGQINSALPLFESELKAQTKNISAVMVGKLRTQLELALSYQQLSEINQFLMNKWLAYERSRPNSELHEKWYQLMELLHLTQYSKDEQSQQKINKLRTQFANNNIQSEWLSFLLDGGTSPDNVKVESQYRRWQSFVRLVEAKKLSKASKKLSKLKVSGLIFTAPGQDKIPDLKVFDPRIPEVLKEFYAASMLEECPTVAFGSYYCGRALEVLGEKKQAIIHHKKALVELDELRVKSAKSNFIEHVLLTSHTSLKSFKVEINARLKALGAVEVSDIEKKEVVALSKQNKALPSTVDQLWSAYSQEQSQALPELFPERRRVLGQIFSQVLEEVKGPQLDYLASLGLNDRWLDELHYQYAKLLVNKDQRVKALKVLNASEEAKAGSRLQGRNRLPRLLLSAYNQLKMGRHRVSAKYFQRLKEKIPALSFVLVMTSDILSGKSFENNGSRANVGQ